MFPSCRTPPHYKLMLDPTDDAEYLDPYLHPLDCLEQERNSAGLSCVALLYRSWFKRLWIVQELVLAQKFELRCGSVTISNSEFFTALESSEWKAWNQVGSLSKPLTERVLSLKRLRDNLATRNGPLSLVSLAHDFQEWDCGNDHDRLNALYGISNWIGSLDFLFQPDYSISAMDLYYRFAEGYLKRPTGGLDILHYAGFGSFLASHLSHSSGSNPISPSWVPDWRIRNRAQPLSSWNKFASRVSHNAYIFRTDQASKTLTVWATLNSTISHVRQSIF